MEASVILQTATENSLLIIDELGRGTSTFDGYGLAYSISEYIITKINCYTLFATHFHELTILQTNYMNSVINKHVSAIISDTNELIMLYKLEIGPCLQSFGINIAKIAKFPKSVINNAKRKAIELENLNENENDTCNDMINENGIEIESEINKKKHKMEIFHQLLLINNNNTESNNESNKEKLCNELKIMFPLEI